MAQEYWFCIIGPVERDNLPAGSDFPMRVAVKEQFAKLTGNYADSCWSGWGNSEEQKDKLLDVCIKN